MLVRWAKTNRVYTMTEPMKSPQSIGRQRPQATWIPVPLQEWLEVCRVQETENIPGETKVAALMSSSRTVAVLTMSQMKNAPANTNVDRGTPHTRNLDAVDERRQWTSKKSN